MQEGETSASLGNPAGNREQNTGCSECIRRGFTPLFEMASSCLVAREENRCLEES